METVKPLAREARPKSISILGKQFKIEYKAKIGKSKDIYGETHVHERRIEIRSDQAGDAFEDTLLHEVIHSILGAAGVSELIKDGDLEEAIVIALENGLSQLYRRR